MTLRTLAMGLVLAGLSGSAVADLYVWKDPATGATRIYSYPPPWYGNPELERRSPKVEHIPARRSAPVVQPIAAPVAAALPEPNPAPAAQGAPPPPAGLGGAVGGLASAFLAPLEAQRKRLLGLFSALPSKPDYDRAGQGLQQQLEAYQAVAAEMDRIDPKGAEARRTESRALVDRLRDGLRAQTGTQAGK